MIPTWLIGAASGLALLVGTFVFGRSTGIDHQKAVYAKAEAKAVAAMEKGRAAIETVSGQLATAQRDQSSQFRTIYNETTRIIERPVYHNVCVDGDGVRLLDNARSAANANFRRIPTGDAARASGDAP
jgi:hypothetical protein